MAVTTIEIIAAVNDEDVLRSNLSASPCVAEGKVRLHAMRGFDSAGKAYNAGLERTTADLVVFAHQDVYLPREWEMNLLDAARWLDEHDPNWALLGCVGVDGDGRVVGRAWSSGLRKVVGRVPATPTAVESFDELVIVLRRDSGVRFDDGLPGFHLYGTDVVQSAKSMGRTAYVFGGAVVHNSVPVRAVDRDYRRAYRYVQRKCRDRLPIPTTVMPVTAGGWPLRREWLRRVRRRLLGRLPDAERHPMPEQLAQELGF